MKKSYVPYPLQMGHDTEFFLWDSKKEQVIPSYRYFKEKKKEKTIRLSGGQTLIRAPFIFDSAQENSSFTAKVFRDGLAVEVNTAPVFCRAWIWQDMKLALAHVLSTRWPKRTPKHIKFTARPVVDLTKKMIADFPKDLRVLGCNPTLDAYTQSQKQVLVDPMKLLFRTSGAHLHLSFEEKMPEEFWSPIIKLADLMIGVPFTYIFGDTLEFKRRTLYGQAGEFRFQRYPDDYTGLEYRVLSSRLYNHPGIFSLFMGIWRYVIGENAQHLVTLLDPAMDDDVREAINLGTPALFPKLLEKSTSLINSALGCYTFRLHSTKIEGSTEIWDKLKKLNEAGAFPDAGIINHLPFPEAHKGYTEYARTEWNY